MKSNDIKKIVVGTSIHSESYDACINCRQETPIASLNLVSGLCNSCSPRRNNRALLAEMIRISERMEIKR